MSKNAVVVRAGRESTHDLWLKGAAADFDLIVVAYDDLPARLTEGTTACHYIPGSKVSGWARLFQTCPEILERYDRIALLDDDLICSAREINAAFALGQIHNLSLWQPSLSHDSFFTYALFQRNSLFALRYVNFIEMMCPFFSADYLESCLPLFELGYETGIDRLWCCLHPTPYRAFAVLDAVTFAHPRPVGKNRSQQGFLDQTDGYQVVLDQMEARLERPFRGTVAYGGILSTGKPVEGRAFMACCALVPLLHWTRAKQARCLKRFAILFRNILTRPINNNTIDIVAVSDRLK